MSLKWLQYALKIALTFILLTTFQIQISNGKPQNILDKTQVWKTSRSNQNVGQTNRLKNYLSDRTVRFEDIFKSEDISTNIQNKFNSPKITMPDNYERTLQKQSNRSKGSNKITNLTNISSSVGVLRENGSLKIIYPKQKNSQTYQPTSEIINANTQTRFKDSVYDENNKKRPFVRGKRESDIVFPDDRDVVDFIPRCKEGELFCSDVPSYPSEYVANILKAEGHKYDELFGEDFVTTNINVTQRIDVPGEEPMCNSREKLIYPQVALSSGEQWRFIVNNGNYTQGVRIEECIEDGSPCRMSNNFPNGYTARCQQKFIYRQLISINDQGRTEKELYKFPSCCKCILKFG